jgi:hypothetical protein
MEVLEFNDQATFESALEAFFRARPIFRESGEFAVSVHRGSLCVVAPDYGENYSLPCDYADINFLFGGQEWVREGDKWLPSLAMAAQEILREFGPVVQDAADKLYEAFADRPDTNYSTAAFEKAAAILSGDIDYDKATYLYECEAKSWE